MAARGRKRKSPGKLPEDPFSYQETKDGKVFISQGGRVVTTLKGKAAESFLAKIRNCDERRGQFVMAKATGNFKRGNER